MTADVLFSFVGNHDPLQIPGPGDDPGPVLSLLRDRPFDHVVLFITRGEYAERAEVIRRVTHDASLTAAATPHADTATAPPADTAPQPPAADTPTTAGTRRTTFSFVDIELQSVVDYEEIYRNLTESIPRVLETLPYRGTRNYVLLDPGTPQMQTVWFLLVRSGGFPATLLQGIPSRFGGGRYRCREVRLDPARFPLEVRLRSENEPSGSAVADAPSTRGDDWTILRSEIVGASPAMRALIERTNRAARYDDVTVCITGETGTGKELLARHIHERSPRRGKPFIPVNCGALPQGLVESSLFGHRKGAYTGADSDRPGSFRSAEGGTIFLDEIGELPLPVQAMLLRVIDQGEITPVGEDRPRRVNVRIIAATNRDLPQMIAEGTFRADLYERLQQVPIQVPPLRDREGDAVLLAQTFLDRWNGEHHTSFAFTPESIEQIARYTWPRNVRQLQNVVRRLCMYHDTPEIDVAAVENAISGSDSPSRTAAVNGGSTVPPAYGARDPRTESVSVTTPSGDTSRPVPNYPVDLVGLLEETERTWYARALEEAAGNRAEAARVLGLKPPAFRKALRERFPDLL
ncbi:MAG: sigma-54 interaction domain-containing protein [Alkalispirochaeta sp.]